jgi:2',3'-cyclic-nucleotide 2'-phosphodiesterase (5'-nucleotidase family)
MEADPLIEELLLKYSNEISGAYEILGTNSRYLDDSVVEQIVADLYYRYGVEKWGDEYDITLGGGFLRTRNPYNLKSGQITYSDIYSLLPFDNELVLCSISGRDLKRKFINTTNSDYYICYGDNDISAINDNATYYVVVDTYTSTYAYNNLTEVARFGSGIYARDLFAEYIREGGLA